MQTSKDEIINIAKNALRDLYNTHKDEGILTIYIWGSITRTDFDVKNSDIDVVCVVDDLFKIENNEKFKEELGKFYSQREWGFQIIYLDELNGGIIRSRLAKVMSPQSILPSFPSWMYIIGNEYKRSDFMLNDASFKERMQSNIKGIHSYIDDIQNSSGERKIRNRKGVVKTCLQLIYNKQLMRNDYFNLNYDSLPDKADDLERPILNDLLKIKNQGLYEEKDYEPYLKKIIQFTNHIEDEILNIN